MRYDRMIATILALPALGVASRSIAWRQLVDILAQAGDRLDPDTRGVVHARLAELSADVPAADRRNAAASLATRAGVDVVAIFARDAPAIAAPVLSRARLGDADWLALIPTLPPPSRTILRNRRDLSSAVVRALATFGASDFALPPAVSARPFEVREERDRPETPDRAAAEPSSQISHLVERIETFRRRKPTASLPLDLAGDADSPGVATFTFETNLSGTIDWIGGVPRGALIGMSIAQIAPPRAAGVDGQAAGAFRRRAPFRDARLAVGGESPAGGDWLISGRPVFDPRDGRFAGYHGRARRPLPEESARRFGAMQTVPVAPDSLRQLVHELRTPLNAIQGFADMINQQMLGPAAAAYREHARSIAGESRRLLEVVEDIDMAARLDGKRNDAVTPGESDAAAIVADACLELEPSLGARGIAITARIERNVMVAVGERPFSRLARRLLAMASAVAADGETVSVTLAHDGPAAMMIVTRPAILRGKSESEIFDPGFGPDGEWPSAPLLGIGFSLRLIANLAREVRGGLTLRETEFVLVVPRLTAEGARTGEQR